MKIIPIKGFELHQKFMGEIYAFFKDNNLDYNKVTQEQSGNQKFIKIELSIKVE